MAGSSAQNFALIWLPHWLTLTSNKKERRNLHKIFREGHIHKMMNASRTLGRPCRLVNSSRRGKDPTTYHVQARRSSQDDSPQLFELLSDPVQHRRAPTANARKNMSIVLKQSILIELLAPILAKTAGCRPLESKPESPFELRAWQSICATHLPLYSLSCDHYVLPIAASNPF